MDVTEKYFLYILKCFYKKEECIPPEDEIDLRKLIEISGKHDVQGIVFYKLQNLKFFKESEYYNENRLMFFAMARKGVEIEVALDLLIKVLNENKIPHTLFKGSVVRNYYPSKELRTMGDIDILVEEVYTDRMIKALKDAGFIRDEKHFHSNAIIFKFNNIEFEIHSVIASRNCTIHKSDFIKFFSEAFKHTEKVREFTYILNAEYHLAYLFFHLLKHFERSGCGVRLFLDFPFYINGKGIDYEKTFMYLKEINLEDFAKSVLTFCRDIFGLDVPAGYCKKISDDVFSLFIEKVINGGTFGQCTKETITQKIQRGTINAETSSKTKGALRMIFPSREYLHFSGVWNKKIPVVFLPVGYIKRIFIQVFRKKRGIAFIKDYKNYTSDNLNKQLLTEIGIIENN